MTTDTPAVGDDRRINIWAYQWHNVDLKVKEDASLDLTKDEPKGQSGWTLGLEFKNFAELIQLLSGQFDLPSYFCGNLFFSCGPIKPGQVQFLAIHAHGNCGVVDIDGLSSSQSDVTPLLESNPKYLNKLSIHGKFGPQIAQLNRILRPDGGVFFMGCKVASSPAGTEFLLEMSRALPGRFIGGITSVGYCDMGRQRNPGGPSVNYPGMRDTQYSDFKVPGMPSRDYETLAVWNDLQWLPWADWHSTHAKFAKDGLLVRDAPEPLAYPMPYQRGPYPVPPIPGP